MARKGEKKGGKLARSGGLRGREEESHHRPLRPRSCLEGSSEVEPASMSLLFWPYLLPRNRESRDGRREGEKARSKVYNETQQQRTVQISHLTLPPAALPLQSRKSMPAPFLSRFSRTPYILFSLSFYLSPSLYNVAFKSQPQSPPASSRALSKLNIKEGGEGH